MRYTYTAAWAVVGGITLRDDSLPIELVSSESPQFLRCPLAIQTYLLIVYFYSAFIHANVGWKLEGASLFVVTPRFHHWHHGEEREAIDVNFAIHFPLFDRLFGTYHMPRGRWPKSYGIEGHPVPVGYWQQFLYPFRR